MKDEKVVVTGVAIAFHTKYQFSPGHGKGRIGPPLLIQEKDIPEVLREQILAFVQKHAEKYWAEEKRE